MHAYKHIHICYLLPAKARGSLWATDLVPKTDEHYLKEFNNKSILANFCLSLSSANPNFSLATVTLSTTLRFAINHTARLCMFSICVSCLTRYESQTSHANSIIGMQRVEYATSLTFKGPCSKSSMCKSLQNC